MQVDPTTRFTSRVEAYERYRPSYPPEVLELARRECGLTAGSRVADIGCGTGLMARIFLDAGCEVFGVEPNAGMREAGERAVGGYPGFHSVAGRAEATTLKGTSFDLVTAGQAFHWFEPEAACAEFRRILKPSGWVMLVWNERRDSTAFMTQYEAATARYAPEQPRVNTQRLADFFGSATWRAAQFSNEQRLDREGLRGRLASSSYAPQPDTPEFEQLMQVMDELFDKHQRGGLVTIEYETDVFYGAWA
jgi:ubiquinone/menaquinone biosynthesis C-methylase UbiE